MILKIIGNNIRNLHKASGLSQIDLAIMIGMDRSYLSEIENGHRNIMVLLLENFATALHVSIEDLLK